MVHLWAPYLLFLPVGTTSDAGVRVLSISPVQDEGSAALRVTTMRAKTASAGGLHGERQI